MNLKKLERYLRVNLLGPGRGLTKVEKHWFRLRMVSADTSLSYTYACRGD